MLYDFNKNKEFDVDVQKFANRYNMSIKDVTYMLKDLWTYDKWCKIKESAVSVDYTSLIETEDNTTPQQELACAGGACEV